MQLPSYFVENVLRVFGEDGRFWLPRLPAITAACREQWGLGPGVLCASMSMNYIEFSTNTAGTPVALKIGVPHPELFSEMEALRLYGGAGAVRLLASDRALGAILMQHLQPGTMLCELEDNREETRVAAAVMQRLSRPAPARHGLPPYGRWLERAFRLTRTIWDPQERMPRDLIDAAACAFQVIEDCANGDVLLHGDLHHKNILLDAHSGWTAVDPKGVIGPPCLEVGRFLQNQLPGSLPLTECEVTLRQRVSIFGAELGYPEAVIAAAGLVDTVLSLCWSFEESELGDDWDHGLEIARILSKMWRA